MTYQRKKRRETTWGRDPKWNWWDGIMDARISIIGVHSFREKYILKRLNEKYSIVYKDTYM